MSPWLAGLAFRRPLVVDPKVPVDYDAEDDDKPAEGKTLERLLTTYWPIAMNQLARSFKSVRKFLLISSKRTDTWVAEQFKRGLDQLKLTLGSSSLISNQYSSSWILEGSSVNYVAEIN